MKYPGFVFLLLIAITAKGQKADYVAEINQQVWKPFIEAFNNSDDERFSSVHSRDVTRVEQDGRRIYGFDQCSTKVSDSVNAKWPKQKRHLELRVIQRLAR